MKYAMLILLSLILSGCFLSGGNSCQYAEPDSSFHPINVQMPKEVTDFISKFHNGFPIAIAIVGDSTTFHLDTDNLNSFVKTFNSSSSVSNFGHPGWTSKDYVINKTIEEVAAMQNKPDVVFLALGINDVANRAGDAYQEYNTILIQQIKQLGMIPVLAKENNISCDGEWREIPYWKYMRYLTDKMATDLGLAVIDLGSEDGVINPSLMYDYIHPNADGYKIIIQKYENWLMN